MARDFIEWTGGECPVPADTPVQLLYREQRSEGSFSQTPQLLNWQHRSRRFGGDIIGYRVLSRVEAASLEQGRIKHLDKMRAMLRLAMARRESVSA